MKNLIGAAAPTQRIFKSFKFLMLVVLVTFGFTSCKDQSKSNVSQESELIEKSNFQDEVGSIDIGGNQLPPGGFCELYSNRKSDNTSTIGGGKSSDGGLGMLNALSSSTTGIGGKSSGGGDYSISDIGGRGNTDTGTGQFTFCDIGGMDSGGGLGNYNTPSPNTDGIGGKSTTGENSISDIGGRGGVDPPGGIYINAQPSPNGRIGCMLRDF